MAENYLRYFIGLLYSLTWLAGVRLLVEVAMNAHAPTTGASERTSP